RAVAGDHHHYGSLEKSDLLNARQRLHPIHARQPHIQKHKLVAALAQLLQALLTALDRTGQETFVGKDAAQRLANPRLVSHNQNETLLYGLVLAGLSEASAILFSSAVSTMAGISIVNRAPTGKLSSTRICALWSDRM